MLNPPPSTATKPRGIRIRSPAAILGGLRGALLCSLVAAQVATPSLEDKMKATFLYKFALFVTWPPQASQRSTFDLCLSGNDEVTKIAGQSVAGQTINGKPVSIHSLSSGETPDSCRVLYVANSGAPSGILDAVHDKPILTITDAARSQHGIIGFTHVGHYLRFDVDCSLAADAGLTISPDLLDVAHAVVPAAESRR
jgi:hypothetical protein